MATDNELAPAPLDAAGAVRHESAPTYIWPSDPLIKQNLEHWRDLKLGVIIHWGIYTAIGQGGSWSLHREDLGWFTDPPASWSGTNAEYHTWYYDQARTFTGEDFAAQEWAAACSAAGMRYCIFTTKHHDGFCMYDSAYTNTKCTSEESGLHRDILREVADAFRGAGLEMGAYFSKADWSRPEYWNRSLPIKDRFHNYDISAHPRAWERFVEFTQDQVDEILTNYGPFSVLWLDGGWVREPEEPIDIDGIARVARLAQPGILVVDREVPGPHQNYLTPEQQVPTTPLQFPWEACISQTKEWCAMRPDDPAKPTAETIGNLLRIVAGGGNYLIGIGPDARGRMVPSVRQFLQDLGEWMQVCGEGIYSTRPPENPPSVTSDDDITWYLTARDGFLYAFGHSGADEVPATTLRVDARLTEVTMLGGGPLSMRRNGDATFIDVPPSATRWASCLRMTLA
ncbi:alpha-L-fucosidase [Actinomyces sp. MRS3W]|uniref:alpha-L-fucosidase n=1 Tax=Actinomyces sp. MRS3W TaxID=2800796 RepID=UPI0028FD51B9|nr:alpha-L-fucosidase [Actinomyces sp. MRS3W]MDU0349349.1 alpha-L-fucosidase [Actinomyces sp. MRS3W]